MTLIKNLITIIF